MGWERDKVRMDMEEDGTPYVMSMYRNKDDMISDMRAEITRLQSELKAERELADRLASAGQNAVAAFATGDFFVSSIDEFTAALSERENRRNK